MVTFTCVDYFSMKESKSTSYSRIFCKCPYTSLVSLEGNVRIRDIEEFYFLCHRKFEIELRTESSQRSEIRVRKKLNGEMVNLWERRHYSF